jgi:hypothetical protein
MPINRLNRPIKNYSPKGKNKTGKANEEIIIKKIMKNSRFFPCNI